MLTHQRPSPKSEMRCDSGSKRDIKFQFSFYLFLKSSFSLLFLCILL